MADLQNLLIPLAAALTTIDSPLSLPADRRAATEFCEILKLRNDAASLGLTFVESFFDSIAATQPIQPIPLNVAFFGLVLLQHNLSFSSAGIHSAIELKSHLMVTPPRRLT
ncbi:hypothetical protein HK100_002557 [Physocladia obscura]|uniref:Uncharacterized protein n=1 Tax=Physocladia obscura TaxID=109957 RepID=A0AAD5SVM5_9FUNG|nr:hypothetical protein HK100_002557 [Physocladia obscura]